MATHKQRVWVYHDVTASIYSWTPTSLIYYWWDHNMINSMFLTRTCQGMLGKERITKILIFSLSKGKLINTYSTVKLLLGCSTLQCNSNTLWNHQRTMIMACNEIMLSKCKVLSTQVIHEMNRKTRTCIISGASGPHMEAPRTLSVSASTTSFITVFSCRLETKMRSYILIKKHRKHREHFKIKVKGGRLEY